MWDSKTRGAKAYPQRLESGRAVAACETSPLRALPTFYHRPFAWQTLIKSSSERPRAGFVVKEFLLVLSVIGSAMVGFTLMDLPDGGQRTDWATPPDVMIDGEVDLGPEFACTVRLLKFSASQQRPYYLSRVQFACRDADRSEPFAIDVLSEVMLNSKWVDWTERATVRLWSLMSVDASLDYLYEHGKIAIDPSELTEQERTSLIIDSVSFEVQEVSSLDEPLWRCVPMSLQEEGIVVNTGGSGLKYLPKLQTGPFRRLARAIRSAALRDHWTVDDPNELLPMENANGRVLTVAQQHAVAQSLVYRLRDHLPEDASVTLTGTPSRSQAIPGTRSRSAR